MYKVTFNSGEQPFCNFIEKTPEYGVYYQRMNGTIYRANKDCNLQRVDGTGLHSGLGFRTTVDSDVNISVQEWRRLTPGESFTVEVV
jgi:hypothetical protein